MNKEEKEVIGDQLDEEEKTLKELEKVYRKAREDVAERIAELEARKGFEPENLQTIIYQKRYQEALDHELTGILENLKNGSYTTINDYLRDSYINGYAGNAWLITTETGVPFLMPIDERKVVRALTVDSQLSRRYYQANPLLGRLEEDYELLKTRVRSNLSRGIASGMTWVQVASNIAHGMNNPFTVAMNDAMRIVRTEGHRVNQQGALDAGQEAVDHGADIVKQWDATLDDRTRPWHMEADGQIREWGQKFNVMGEELDAPAIGGSAPNVINCRCQLLKRARWALDEKELEELKERAEFFGLDKTEQFEEYKKKFLKLPENADTVDLSERRKQRLSERQNQSEKNSFIPASDMREVKTRLSSALGIDESVINLGRMKLELANQYLDGVETFMRDFPQMKGLYTAMNTKRCSGGVLGINYLNAVGRYVGRNMVYDCTLELGFKSPTDLNDLYYKYKYAYESAQHYKGTSPKATAIHELVHGLTYAVQMKKNGFFSDGVLQTTIDTSEWFKYTRTGTYQMVNGVKQEMFGVMHGEEVYKGMMHLGSYAMSNPDETVAQAVSYEYINPTESKPFSKKILESLMKEVGEAFK